MFHFDSLFMPGIRFILPMLGLPDFLVTKILFLLAASF
jgi:hypothetical protein